MQTFYYEIGLITFFNNTFLQPFNRHLNTKTLAMFSKYKQQVVYTVNVSRSLTNINIKFTFRIQCCRQSEHNSELLNQVQDFVFRKYIYVY